MDLTTLPQGLKQIIASYVTIYIFPQTQELLVKRYQRLIKPTIKNGHVGQLRELISCGKSPHPKATFYAAKYNQPQCLSLLITAGYPKHAKARDIAAVHGYNSCLQLLIGAQYPRNNYELLENVEINNLEGLKLSLHETWESMDIKMALIRACCKGYIQCIRLLMPLNSLKHSHYICCAGKNGHVECLNFLIDNGYPVGSLAPLVSAQHGQLECLKILLATGVVPRDPIRSYYLHPKCAMESLQLLLEAGYRPDQELMIYTNTMPEDEKSVLIRQYLS